MSLRATLGSAGAQFRGCHIIKNNNGYSNDSEIVAIKYVLADNVGLFNILTGCSLVLYNLTRRPHCRRVGSARLQNTHASILTHG